MGKYFWVKKGKQVAESMPVKRRDPFRIHWMKKIAESSSDIVFHNNFQGLVIVKATIHGRKPVYLVLPLSRDSMLLTMAQPYTANGLLLVAEKHSVAALDLVPLLDLRIVR